MNKSLYTFCLLISTLSLSAQNITPEMISKAKQMGATEAQIQAVATSPDNKAANVTKNTQRTQLVSSPSVSRDSVVASKVFGSEIFSTDKLSFEPNYNMPTPPDYILAAGDELIINIWGTSEQNHTTKVSPDGSISIPNIGLIFLNGQSIEQAQKTISGLLSKIYSGMDQGEVQVKVSLGQMRSIKVNIAGEVVAPGTYTLPSLTTLFNAMYVAGGVNKIGSLRDIKVFRQGRQIANLDVYDYIINGKYSSNISLADNDMIVVSPYQNHVTISGKVKRDRIFELKNSETLADLILYAGGFTGDAYTDNVEINRSSGPRYQIYTVDNKDFATFHISDGDAVSIGATVPKYDNRVTITGAVWRQGAYQLSDKLNSVKALIAKAEGLMGDAYLEGAQLKRQKEDFTYQIIPINLLSILNGTSKDIQLQKEDNILIPSKTALQEPQYIIVRGEVNGIASKSAEDILDIRLNKISKKNTGIYEQKDGTYRIPYMQGMSLQDAIVLSGGFKESAAQSLITIVSRTKDPLSTTYTNDKTKTYTINLDQGLDANTNSFVLEPFDQVVVRKSPGFATQRFAKIVGEVVIEGQYSIDGQTRISDLVSKSSGLTPLAYAKGAQLRRKISELDITRIEAKLKLLDSNTGADSLNSNAIKEIPKYELVGINLAEILKKPKSDIDLLLQEGDELVIPEMVNTVKISGAVYFPNTTVYSPSYSYRDYISKAGGYTQNARKRAYVVYMNGQVASKKKLSSLKIEPGCEIIVPMKQKRNNTLSLPEILSMTTSATSIAALISSIVK